MSLADRLEELEGLYKIGRITEDEHRKARAAALGIGETVGAPDVLARHFAEAERRELEPWRKVYQTFAARRKLWAAQTKDSLKARFADMARNKDLSATEALIGTYLLYGEEEARTFFAALICHEMPADRIKAHNFYVAEMLGEEFLVQHGEVLTTMPYPLFPPNEAFSLINHRLMSETRMLEGGATDQPSVYKRREGDEILGGGILPVQMTPEGHPFVETTPMENWVDATYVRRGRGRGYGRGRAQPAPRAPPPKRQVWATAMTSAPNIQGIQGGGVSVERNNAEGPKNQ